MSKNYFAIERNAECHTPVILADRNGDITFAEFLDMSYEEMKSSEALEYFVIAAMEAADNVCGIEDDQTIVTLVGSDDVFIWSILMGYENDEIRYCLVDWKKDGYSYMYEPEITP